MTVCARTLATDAVRARDGLIGRVKDILFDNDQWIGRFMVVQTGPWIFGRKLLLSPLHVRELDAARTEIRIGLTRAEVRSVPDLRSVDVVSRAKEREYEEIRRTPTYWGGSGLWGTQDYPDAMPSVNVPQTVERKSVRDEVRLVRHRSTRAIEGYRALAGDEPVGVVEDLLLDAGSFAVKGFVVERPEESRRVPVPVEWIEGIRWIDSTVRIAAGAEAVSDLPDCGETGC